jgi:hypothetical protein
MPDNLAVRPICSCISAILAESSAPVRDPNAKLTELAKINKKRTAEVDSLHFFEGLQVDVSRDYHIVKGLKHTLLRVSGRMKITHKPPRARVAMKMMYVFHSTKTWYQQGLPLEYRDLLFSNAVGTKSAMAKLFILFHFS